MVLRLESDLSGEMQFDISAENIMKIIGAATMFSGDDHARVPLPSVLPALKPRRSNKEVEQAYTGFLLIECEECGKRRGFYSKKPVSVYYCSCGHETKLSGLMPAFPKCRCGSTFKYMTNIQSNTFTYKCLDCHKPIYMQLSSNKAAYVVAR